MTLTVPGPPDGDGSTQSHPADVAERFGDYPAVVRWHSDFAEIGETAASTAFGHPGQLLDWRRFCPRRCWSSTWRKRGCCAKSPPRSR